MTTPQIILFVLLLLVFVFLIWGRWRYDLVAFAALVAALILGVVPTDQAFAGFGHPATVIVALVLVVSRALSNSGVVEWIGRFAISTARGLAMHIGIMSGIAATLSAVMNNVAALALLMPVDLEAAAKARRSPALTLMPLSFASILGGMITLIGTPPNIIIAAYRAEALGDPYAMFDFAPVGIVCTIAGVLFVTLIGWRLIPAARSEHDSGKELFNFSEYVSEVEVSEASPIIGQRVRDLDDIAEEHEVSIIGLIRHGRRSPGMARTIEIAIGDLLVIETGPDALDKFVGALKLKYVRHPGKDESIVKDEHDLDLMEVVVPEGARIEKRTAMQLKLLARHDVTLLGVSRQGRRFRESVRNLPVQAGDILIFLGPTERLPHVVNWLGCLPLAERGLKVMQRGKALLTVSIFALAVLVASIGLVNLAVALGSGGYCVCCAKNRTPARTL